MHTDMQYAAEEGLAQGCGGAAHAALLQGGRDGGLDNMRVAPAVRNVIDGDHGDALAALAAGRHEAVHRLRLRSTAAVAVRARARVWAAALHYLAAAAAHAVPVLPPSPRLSRVAVFRC